ncbi:chromate transporter [Paenibacillus sambharensis]|uniref:Chromate transporter n=1 Tax=Paenibacillus sambharensis TaxID=1803190 RepID=A0A2W1LHC9_9BACL|nr:chromate transporter [Paenibacillus sambharensis]PZD97470.1 chromate transporter [Paenibacillus sambharensis]
MLWDLFLTFLKIGFVSFGGGYAVIPLIQHDVSVNRWLSPVEFQETISLAGMAPGPIATNSATLIGFKTAGYMGAILSTLGMILPSLLVVVLLTSIFIRLQHNKWLKSSFYGMRPIITGLIVYAAIHLGLLGTSEALSWKTTGTLAICAGSLYIMLRYKFHPFTVILLSGAAGIIIF